MKTILVTNCQYYLVLFAKQLQEVLTSTALS